MRTAASALLFLTMAPLGLMAAELRTGGDKKSNVQATAVIEAQHRVLRRRGGRRGRGRRRRGDDSDDSTDSPAPAPETPAPTPQPSMTEEPSPTTEPSSEPTAEPSMTEVPSPTPEPTAEPTSVPTAEPTSRPTAEPTSQPTAEPTYQPTAEPTEEPASDMETLLELHNVARCRHNADPLSYSDEVASYAELHAEVLASDCGQFYHSASDDRNNYGENIYLCSGIPSCYIPEGAMYLFYEEEIDYATVAEYGGHATQILWKSTTELGCAVSTCEVNSAPHTYLVCQYNPAGNILSNLEDEVDYLTDNTC